MITDGGSAKGSVVADCRAAALNCWHALVPGHRLQVPRTTVSPPPFRRTLSKTGAILTPLAENDARRPWGVCARCASLRCRGDGMLVQHYDEVLAATSHLPHMLAFGLVDMLAR